jgi:hypothetical protein
MRYRGWVLVDRNLANICNAGPFYLLRKRFNFSGAEERSGDDRHTIILLINYEAKDISIRKATLCPLDFNR